MKTLVAFYNGTAGEYVKMGNLAPILISHAAQMRNDVSDVPKKLEVEHEDSDYVPDEEKLEPENDYYENDI